MSLYVIVLSGAIVTVTFTAKNPLDISYNSLNPASTLIQIRMNNLAQEGSLLIENLQYSENFHEVSNCLLSEGPVC